MSFSPIVNYNLNESRRQNGTARHTNEDNVVDKSDPSTPLMEAESIPLPPRAEPENDEDEEETPVTKPYPGIDDGFFPRPDADDPDKEKIPLDGPEIFDRAGGGHPAPFPYAPGFGPRSEFGGIDPESIPDVNIYQHKKTVAQGMMDIALFSANANQLRYVLESSNHPYYYPGLVLISISLLFQVAVGVGLLLNTQYNVKDKKEICVANKVSNFTIIGIFLVTVINVFISAFGVATNN